MLTFLERPLLPLKIKNVPAGVLSSLHCAAQVPLTGMKLSPGSSNAIPEPHTHRLCVLIHSMHANASLPLSPPCSRDSYFHDT